MSNMIKSSLVRPNIHTPFHIDWNWWKETDNNWNVYLLSYLCPQHQEYYENHDPKIPIDLIDPETAEITQIDGLLHLLLKHCALQPDFLSEYNTLVDSVFKTFLVNENQPLTPEELGLKINRSPDIILRTLTGPKIYRGIRPVQ